MQFLQLSDIEKQLSDDLQWALRAPEVRQHAGKFVAIYQKCIVGVGTNRDALVAEAAEKAHCPQQHVVVMTVPSEDLSELPR
jgi:hypothetical protein